MAVGGLHVYRTGIAGEAVRQDDVAVLCDLVNRPVVASNISSLAFYRVIEEKSPTLLIDEADTVVHRNRELRGILNSGYSRRTAYVIRANNRARAGKNGENPEAGGGGGRREMPNGLPVQKEGNGPNGDAEGLDGAANESQLARFSCWCPKAIATIRHLPEVLADRCTVIAMQRKTWQEKSERLRKLNGAELRRKCARFVRDRAEEIASAQPSMPEDLNDRAADIWEPLVALADLAGGDWPVRARDAAVGLTAIAQEESPIGALLFDLMVIFVREKCAQEKAGISTPKAGGTRVFSRDMVAWLNGATDRPWVVMRKGKAVTERWLAQVLRPYGIKPKTLWIGDQAAKGYLEDDFTEVFRRYIGKAAAAAHVKELRADKDDGAQGQTDGPIQKG